MAAPRKVTLAWATDTHFDHAPPDALDAFASRLAASGAEGLLLGGDISVAEDVATIVRRLARAAGLPVWFVLGNHDYYGGSIGGVRARVAALEDGRSRWLPAHGVVDLAPDVALVGVDGWGDARLGDFAGSHALLNDYDLIDDLVAVFDCDEFDGVFGADTPLEKELNRLGSEEAALLEPLLAAAVKKAGHVVVLTHVPPFAEACWHQGEVSSATWLPGFACGAVGDLLRSTATAAPDTRFTVLCGHTHGAGVAHPAENIVVHTRGARYEHPAFVLVDINADGLEVDDG